MKRREFLQSLGLAAGAVAVNGLNLGTLAQTNGPDAFNALGADIHIGDVLTFEGKFARNPITREYTEHLQRYVVTAVQGDSIALIPNPDPPLTRENRERPEFAPLRPKQPTHTAKNWERTAPWDRR